MREPLAKAALVHAFTALGIVCALCAARATISGSFEQAFFWLGVAFLIDGLDGYFARAARVKVVLPTVSGETLDLVIDYVTYVFVPALMLLQAGYLAGPRGLLLAALICMSSLYHFADKTSKSEDHCFVGFPAIWNLVAFYIFAFDPPAWATGLLVLACVALTFVRLKWVHPLRVMASRTLTLAALGLWVLAAIQVIATGFPATGVVKFVLLAVAAYGLGLSLWFGRDIGRSA